MKTTMKGLECSTQSGTTPSSVFFDPSEAFEFVSDDESDPCLFSEDEDGGECAPIKTMISPRHIPITGKEPCSPPDRKAAKRTGGDFMDEDFLSSSPGVMKLKERINVVNQVASSKASEGTFPDIPQVRESRKQSKWRKNLMGCLGGCPALTTPSKASSSGGEQDSRKAALQSTGSRGGLGLGWLVKKFVDYRCKNMKMDLDNLGRSWQYEEPSNTANKSLRGVSTSRSKRKFPVPKFPRPRGTAPTSRTSLPTKPENPNPRRIVGNASARDNHGRGFCDTWDGIIHTRAIGKMDVPVRRPHIGEARRVKRSEFHQTWHGDLLEAASPVQRRNADIMKSLCQINLHQETMQDMAIFQSAISDVHHMEEECQDSLHLQVPLTPASLFSDSDAGEFQPTPGLIATDGSLRAIPEDLHGITPINSMGSRDIRDSYEKYRGDRLMPQDPMLSQKLLFDTLFETCQSFERDGKGNVLVGSMDTITPDPESSSTSDMVFSGYGDECMLLGGIWTKDFDTSDKPEVVCDPAVLEWLFKRSGKHSKHLKIEVHEECIAVTGQVLGGFDRTEILSRSAKGRRAPRCDGRPGSMKVWIENIPNGFRERNSWDEPQPGAKMDEYEISDDGQTLVLTTHVTFKMGRNCRLRSRFRRLGERCDHQL